MVNKCSIIGCHTNYSGHEKGAVYPLPEEKEQRKKWLLFANRESSLKHLFVCYKHFEGKFLRNTAKYVKLIKNLKPVPTIIPKTQKISNLPATAILETIKPSRKPPTIRVFQKDEMDMFTKQDQITSLNDITESSLKTIGLDFFMNREEDFLTLYRIEKNNIGIPDVSYCIRIDQNLRVMLFYRNSPISLPNWFRQGRNTILNRFSMLTNFISHMKQVIEDKGEILEEMNNLRYSRVTEYSPRLIRYALHLRYTSLQSYKLLLEELPLPSVSYLRKLTSGESLF